MRADSYRFQTATGSSRLARFAVNEVFSRGCFRYDAKLIVVATPKISHVASAGAIVPRTICRQYQISAIIPRTTATQAAAVFNLPHLDSRDSCGDYKIKESFCKFPAAKFNYYRTHASSITQKIVYFLSCSTISKRSRR
jgi:hypothetical protein